MGSPAGGSSAARKRNRRAEETTCRIDPTGMGASRVMVAPSWVNSLGAPVKMVTFFNLVLTPAEVISWALAPWLRLYVLKAVMVKIEVPAVVNSW